ncbi:hypothetical protein [Albidovulum sp.]
MRPLPRSAATALARAARQWSRALLLVREPAQPQLVAIAFSTGAPRPRRSSGPSPFRPRRS